MLFRSPLNGPDSVLAAEASHCANDQGKFWAMHDEIYKNWNGERTGWINRASLSNFGQTAGLDIDALEMVAPLSPGAPVCKAISSNHSINGKEIVFKGGQLGTVDYFEKLKSLSF